MAKLTLTQYVDQGKRLTIPKQEGAEIERLFNKSIGDSDAAIHTITTLFPNLTGKNKTGLIFEVDDITSRFVLIPIEQVKTAITSLLSSQAGTQAQISRDMGQDFDYEAFGKGVEERVDSLLSFVV